MSKRPTDEQLPPPQPTERASWSSTAVSVERDVLEAAPISTTDPTISWERSQSHSHQAKAALTSTSLTENITISSDAAANNTAASNNAKPAPKCFRIANVPAGWDAEKLLGTLQLVDPFLADQQPQLSLFPACSSTTQTALINLYPCTGYFQSLKPNDDNYLHTSDGTLLVIDYHFHHLTPLNAPESQIVAEYYPFATNLASY
jgi:hypothetical protein